MRKIYNDGLTLKTIDGQVVAICDGEHAEENAAAIAHAVEVYKENGFLLEQENEKLKGKLEQLEKLFKEVFSENGKLHAAVQYWRGHTFRAYSQIDIFKIRLQNFIDRGLSCFDNIEDIRKRAPSVKGSDR